MKTSSLIWGGLIATAIFIEWNPKARKKIRKITGLSDSKIPKSELKELVPRVAGVLNRLGQKSNNFNKKKAIIMVTSEINKFQKNEVKTELYKKVIETYPKEVKSMLDEY